LRGRDSSKISWQSEPEIYRNIPHLSSLAEVGAPYELEDINAVKKLS